MTSSTDSSTDSTYIDYRSYNRFNCYYVTSERYTDTTEKVKNKKEPLPIPEKEKNYIFDIKDLYL